jgi:DNA modification methylase
VTVRILQGDCRELMAAMAPASVHAIVTSPPYWGLRDYGTAPLSWPAITYSPMPGLPPCVEIPAMEACLGLEPTLEAFIGHMVMVFREAWRVLRDDGTAWVNMGDCYATGAGKVNAAPGGGAQGERWAGIRPDLSRRDHGRPAENGRGEPQADAGARGGHEGKHGYASGIGPMTQPNRMPQNGLKPKDLAGQPWRLAFALQADGWWLRQDVIWSKKNPMPESTQDRCTKAHEYVFLLSKARRYYWNAEAMQEPASENTHARLPGNKAHAAADLYGAGDEHHRTKGGLVAYAERQRAKYKTPDGWDTSKGAGGHGSFHKDGREKGKVAADRVDAAGDGAYADGKSERLGRGPGWRKLADAGSGTKNNDSFDAAMAVMPLTRNKRSVWHLASEPFPEAHFATFPTELIEPCILASCPPGGTVLDFFGGSGTTGLVADRHQRDAILCELNPEYVAIAEKRIRGDAPLLTQLEAA